MDAEEVRVKENEIYESIVARKGEQIAAFARYSAQVKNLASKYATVGGMDIRAFSDLVIGLVHAEVLLSKCLKVDYREVMAETNSFDKVYTEAVHQSFAK